MRFPGRLLLLCLIAVCAPSGSALAANTEPGGGGGGGDYYCMSSCGVGFGGGGSAGGQAKVWDIWNLDRPVDMLRATQAPTCRKLADAVDTANPTDGAVTIEIDECEEEAARAVTGEAPEYKDIFCNVQVGYFKDPPPDRMGEIKPGSPCLVQPPAHYAPVSDSEDEVHQNIELMRSGRLSDGKMAQNVPIAWIVRVWRVKVDPDAVTLPARTRTSANGEQDPSYPIFERRMNLKRTDGRSDGGRSDNGLVGGTVTQENWWNGGPDGKAQDVPNEPGNWWLDAARGGPIGMSQTAEQNSTCDKRYAEYRNAAIARNGGGAEGLKRVSTAAPLLAGKSSLGMYVAGEPVAHRCFYTWSEQNGMENDAEWFPHVSTTGVTTYRRESIALGWDIYDLRMTPAWQGKDRLRSARLGWRVQAPAGYLYAVQYALIDSREQIIDSKTQFATPSGVQAPPKEGTTSAPPAPGTTVKGPDTLPTGSTVAAGSDKEHRLTVSPTSDRPMDSSDTTTGQQIWFRSSTAYWYDYGQKYDTADQWFLGKSISIDERNREGESVNHNVPVTDIATATNTTGPAGLATEGRAKAITKEHSYPADKSEPMGLGAADGTSLPIPFSSVVSGRASDNTFVRTFAVAQTSPSVRIADQVMPLQFSGRAVAEVAGWQETKLPGADVTAWKNRGEGSWQPDCAVGWNPCVEEIDARPRNVWQPIDPAGGDSQLAGAFVPHGTAPAADGSSLVDGFFQMRLQTRAANGAVGSAGIRALMLRRANGAASNAVRAIWERDLEGTRPRNTVTDGDWSITWCRPGEPTSSLLVTAGSGVLTDIEPATRLGDQGCQADYHRWSWTLKPNLACASEIDPDAGQCVRPAEAYHCPAGTGYSAPGSYLRTNLGLRPGRQAVKQADMPEMRGRITTTEGNERDTFPWKAYQAPCVVPGVTTTGKFVKLNVSPSGFTYGSKGCRNGITGLNINYIWVPGTAVFHPGKDAAWLARYYENQFADSPSEDTVQLETWSTDAGTCVNRAKKTRFVATYNDSDNLQLLRNGDRFAFQTGGVNPKYTVRVQDSGAPRKYFGMPGADTLAFPKWSGTYRTGHLRLGAATGWVYTPHEEHCTDRADGTAVRSCPGLDAQHTGQRLPAGNYFISGTVSNEAGDAATAWRLTVRKFQRKGSNWLWSTKDHWTPAHSTDISSLQPVR